MRNFLRRLHLVAWRLRHGMPLRGATLSGPVHSDLWVSQVSVHRAAARWAADADVVEIGCQGGDGLDQLRRVATPRSIRGFDDDPRQVKSGRRRFGLDLRVVDLARIPGEEASADLLLAVNTLQQLDDPDAALDWLAGHRRPGGRVVVSVPPVVDEGTMAMHRAIPECRTHRFVWEWEQRMRERFPRVTIFRHLPPPGAILDFSRPAPSTLSPDDFDFVVIAPADLDELAGIGIIFLGED